MQTNVEFVLKYHEQFCNLSYNEILYDYSIEYNYSRDRSSEQYLYIHHSSYYTKNIHLKFHEPKRFCGQNRCYDHSSGEECQQFYMIGIVLSDSAGKIQRVYRKHHMKVIKVIKIQSIVRMFNAKKLVDILRCEPKNLFDKEFGRVRRQSMIKEELWKNKL